MIGSMHRRSSLSVAACVLLCAGALAGAGWPAAAAARPALHAGPLAGFTDDLGHVVAADAPAPPLRLVVFGYTTCPDVCPLTMVAVHRALVQLARRGVSLPVAFVSVDPARDTVERLHDYVSAFDERIRGYRVEDDAVLDRFAAGLKVRYWRESLGNGSPEYFMSHTPTLFLARANGDVLYAIPHEPNPDKLARAILSAGLRAAER